ncbi:hypothetical protein H8356DRAFT_1430527 [Neocallimastix lanati (nom. inval.)]|nr:hypothetical protein H8356DRAFT_1430527 [Neocallimastix sp. JGI-2020a]
MTNICSKLCVDNLIFSEAYINKCQNEEPLLNTAHGNKRENQARNAVELRRFVEISWEISVLIIITNNPNP